MSSRTSWIKIIAGEDTISPHHHHHGAGLGVCLCNKAWWLWRCLEYFAYLLRHVGSDKVMVVIPYFMDQDNCRWRHYQPPPSPSRGGAGRVFVGLEKLTGYWLLVVTVLWWMRRTPAINILHSNYCAVVTWPPQQTVSHILTFIIIIINLMHILQFFCPFKGVNGPRPIASYWIYRYDY